MGFLLDTSDKDEVGLKSIDPNGDGIIDNTFISDGELTHDEFIKYVVSKLECEPDTLNISSNKNWVTCYVELPEGYYPWLIDGSLTTLNGVNAYLGKQDWAKSHATDSNTFDYDEDGVTERMLRFDATSLYETLETGEAVELRIEGKLKDYLSDELTSFSVSDYKRVIENNKKDKKN